VQRVGDTRASRPILDDGAASREGLVGIAGTQLPPTAEQLDYGRRFDAAYSAAVAKYDAYLISLEPLQAALKKAGIKPLQGTNQVAP